MGDNIQRPICLFGAGGHGRGIAAPQAIGQVADPLWLGWAPVRSDMSIGSVILPIFSHFPLSIGSVILFPFDIQSV